MIALSSIPRELTTSFRSFFVGKNGKKRTQIDSELPDENTGRYRQLEKKADEFLRGRKSKQENREEYNALLNDIEYELDTASNKHLLNIYDKLLSGKVEPEEKSPHNDRVCEIKIYDVSSLEDAGKYRVTAKIDYAPIHIGETFALLVDDKPTDEKINVLQIGVGDRQWSEKEPDMITTLIVDSDFEHESGSVPNSV